MRIARVAVDRSPAFAVVEGPLDAPLAELEVLLLAQHPLLGLKPTGERRPLPSVRLLAPVVPSKVVGIGKNYADHAAEMGGEVPDEPLMFLKPSTAVVGPDDPVVLPSGVGRVDHEAELAVVMGALARRVRAEDALATVWGYTCANDVSARDLQDRDGQWTRAKGFDSFCPLGPWVETSLDPSDVGVRCLVDGDVRQDGRTSDLVHGVGALIAAVSRVMTLLPGDVVLTGTPAGIGPLVAGQQVTVEVEGIGSLSNPVLAEDG